jgi:peptide deformylase
MTKLTEFLENYTHEGNALRIFQMPAPVLKKKAEPVTEFNEELRDLCKDMLYTMYNAPGIGLAAPQVGKSLRLFVMDIDFDREEITNTDGETEFRLSNFNPLVIINPILKNQEGEVLYEEGCLSVPGVYEEVKRAQTVTVDYQDLNGEHQSIDCDELLSICMQHENDHLEGVLFLEKLSMLKRNMLTKKFLKNKKKR